MRIGVEVRIGVELASVRGCTRGLYVYSKLILVETSFDFEHESGCALTLVGLPIGTQMRVDTHYGQLSKSS